MGTGTVVSSPGDVDSCVTGSLSFVASDVEAEAGVGAGSEALLSGAAAGAATSSAAIEQRKYGWVAE
eukprot:7905395-Prorocentrum_lima.AAC.1